MFNDRFKFLTAEQEQLVKDAVSTVDNDAVAIAFTDLPKNDKEDYKILVVAEKVKNGARRFFRALEKIKFEFIIVERSLFESDVRDSALLEVAAGRLLLPYVALSGSTYLFSWEILYKKRKIEENITDLILEHPELSSELVIDPRYFVHANLLKLSYFSPQASTLLLNLDNAEFNLIKGYLEALEGLEQSGVINIKDDLITIDREHVYKTLKLDISLPDQLNRAQSRLSELLKLGIFGIFDLLKPLPGSSIVDDLLTTTIGASDIPHPERFLYFPTATGLTPLSESIDIEKVLTKLESSSCVDKVQLHRLGGVLNEVYLLTYIANSTLRRVIMKRFPNWVSLKWAPIAIWTLGTKNFAILGRSRIEREYATTLLLNRGGVPVPKILYMSFKDHTLIREYVEGESLAGIVRNIIRKGNLREKERELFEYVGETLAAVHKAGATLGDCKPENFIIKAVNIPVIVDLEQGGKTGNEAWDIAEFLYFSGHYVGPFNSTTGITEMTRCFLRGYINGGGKKESINEAASLRYSKVFTPITLPQILYTIVKTCKTEMR